MRAGANAGGEPPRSGGLRVGVQVVGSDLLDDGGSQVADRAVDSGQLLRGQTLEDRSHPVLLERLDLVALTSALGRRPDDHNAAVIGNPEPLDEAALLHPVDQAGRVADGHVQQVGEVAHRELAVMLEHPQNVEVRHADPGLDHAARAGTAQAADHRVKLIDDGVDELRRGLGMGGAGAAGVDSSHQVNNLATVDDRVKGECRHRRDHSGFDE